MGKIKVKFVDFMPRMLQNNFFLRMMRQRFDVVESDNPDFIFYSDFGTRYRSYNCHRIYFTAENLRANFSECDFALTFDYLDSPNHFRLPLHLLYGSTEKYLKPKLNPDLVLQERTHFCNFVYSNKNAKKRIEFFHKLSKYKRVDSAGSVLNNMNGQRVKDKVAFLRKYKFTIAFENSKHPGYTTEKIVHPMQAGSIPIYWGDPLLGREFNTKSVLNWDDYGSDEALIDRIIEIDQNDDLYLSILKEPWIPGNCLTPNLTGEAFVDFMDGVFSTTKSPVAIDPPCHMPSRLRLQMIGQVRQIIGQRKHR